MFVCLLNAKSEVLKNGILMLARDDPALMCSLGDILFNPFHCRYTHNVCRRVNDAACTYDWVSTAISMVDPVRDPRFAEFLF